MEYFRPIQPIILKLYIHVSSMHGNIMAIHACMCMHNNLEVNDSKFSEELILQPHQQVAKQSMNIISQKLNSS